MKKILFVFAAALFLAPLSLNAHPGKTNADGCHTNKNTGEYHCHGDKTGSGQASNVDLRQESPDEAWSAFKEAEEQEKAEREKNSTQDNK